MILFESVTMREATRGNITTIELFTNKQHLKPILIYLKIYSLMLNVMDVSFLLHKVLTKIVSTKPIYASSNENYLK